MGTPPPGHNRIAALQQDVIEIAHRVVAAKRADPALTVQRIASALGVAEGTVEKLPGVGRHPVQIGR